MKKYKLGEIATIQTGPFGSQLHNEDYVLEGTPIVTVEHLGNKYFTTQNLPLVSTEDKERLKKYLLKENDIVFSRVGSVDRCSFVSEKENGWLFSGRCLRVRPNKEFVNPQWLYYFFTQQYFKDYVRSKAVGCTMPSLNTELLSDLVITTRPLESQQKIAAVLSALDDKIALNRRMNAKLEQMAKRLYDHWFVQFDFPNADGKPYKSSGGKMEYNEVLKREIPDGWEVGKVSELLKCDIPGDWGEEEIKGNHKYKVNCIRGCDMIDMTDLPVRYILESNYKKLLQKDDFVIEISGGSPTQSTGRIVQITDEIIKRFNGKIICSNFCHGIRLNDKDYASYFFQMWNMFYLNNIFFNYEGKTSGLKNFQFDTFVSETWYIPPKELVRKYHEVVSKFRKQIDKNESETQKLTALRDRLLPLLMNGQVEVR